MNVSRINQRKRQTKREGMNTRIPEREDETEGRRGNLREQRASSPRLPSFVSFISNLYVEKRELRISKQRKSILLCMMFLINGNDWMKR